jgi:hypothetical protein
VPDTAKTIVEDGLLTKSFLPDKDPLYDHLTWADKAKQEIEAEAEEPELDGPENMYEDDLLEEEEEEQDES